MNKSENPIVGYFFENKTKSGATQIRVSFPDGTVLFLNYSKDKAGQGIVVLGNGGKTYDLKSADVKVTFDVVEKARSNFSKSSSAPAAKRGNYKSSYKKDDSPF